MTKLLPASKGRLNHLPLGQLITWDYANLVGEGGLEPPRSYDH